MSRNKLNFYLDVVSTLVMVALAFTGFLLFFVLPPGTGGRHGGEALSLWGWTRHDYGDIHFYLALAFIALAVVHVWLHWTWVCTTFACFFGGSKPAEGRRRTYGIGTVVTIALVMVVALLWANSQVQQTVGERRVYDAGMVLGQRRTSEPAAQQPSGDEQKAFAKTTRPVAAAPHNERDVTPSASAQGGEKRQGKPSRGSSASPTPKEEHEKAHVRGKNAITGQTSLADAARIGGLSAQSLRQELGLPGYVDVHERLGRLKRRYGFDIYTVRNIVERRTEITAQ